MSEELEELMLDVREQLRFLSEMGVEMITAELAVKRVAMPVAEVPVTPAAPASPPPKVEVLCPEPQHARRESRLRISELPSLTNRPQMKSSIPTATPVEAPEQPATELFETRSVLPEPVETIEQIRAEIGPDCTRCKLCSLGRKQVVNSIGNFNADLMFVGEAPGADEDAQGEPFVGRAGQLLTDIIEKGLQISRKDVFIGNINRCRPPLNRAPEPDETAACKPFLMREIAVVRPRVIVVLGATAAHNLLDLKTPISKLRGNFQEYQGVKVMPTFHPAYLLRDPHKKREVWEDMKMVRDFLKS